MKTYEDNSTDLEFDGIELEMEEKGFFYSYNMIFDLDISEHAKLLYLYLCRLADNKKTSFPSYNTMGKACTFSRNTAMRAMKELMETGLVIKKRRSNGKEQTSNVYLIFSEPKPDLVAKNKKQLEREAEEFRERNQSSKVVQITNITSEKTGSPSQGLGGLSQGLPPGGICEGLGGLSQGLGSPSQGLEVQPIEVQPIYKYSSSPFPYPEHSEIPEEIILVIKSAYDSMLNSKAQKIQVGDNKIAANKVKEKISSLNCENIIQVANYIMNNNISSRNAIKTALYYSQEHLILQKHKGNDNTIKKENKNAFHNFTQRHYDQETMKDMEKLLLKKSLSSE